MAPVSKKTRRFRLLSDGRRNLTGSKSSLHARGEFHYTPSPHALPEGFRATPPPRTEEAVSTSPPPPEPLPDRDPDVCAGGGCVNRS